MRYFQSKSAVLVCVLGLLPLTLAALEPMQGKGKGKGGKDNPGKEKRDDREDARTVEFAVEFLFDFNSKDARRLATESGLGYLVLARGLDQLAQPLQHRGKLAFRAWIALRSLSWLAEITGHPEEALSFIDRAFTANPTDPWILYQRGRLLAAEDDEPGAMQSFRAALARELDFADALIAMAELSRGAGNFEAAERYYARALGLEMTDRNGAMQGEELDGQVRPEVPDVQIAVGLALLQARREVTDDAA